MEMETSRRSALDRSREPSTKKPRLAEEGERDRAPSAGVASDRTRPYAQARPAVSGGSGGGGNLRFKPSDREREEREDSGKGGSYQQQQELLAQYRTAIAELTFNSKPIITNLTIIAGENLHSAKSITNIVCANVLEVPSVQKLPSLYLLDSIVKNIGRDYIKYFAARLPEVFCKAYEQVDSSVHPSLRHLFGTWKGVFPASCLQSIEKELGFQPIINGSSEGTGTKSDVQTQRAPHSIHVNLKYLEARQRLQQSNRGKEIRSAEIDEIVPLVDTAERSIRTTSAGSMRQLSELPKKNVQLPRREQQPSDFTNEKKSYKDARDLSFASQLLQKPDLGVGRIIVRVNELDEMGRTVDRVKESDEPSKAYFRAEGAAESTAYRRNGFDADHVFDSYRALGSVPNNSHVPSIHSNRVNWPTSKSWKASEEEEYIWDDMGSRSVEYEGTGNKRNSWSTDDLDKPTNLQSHKWLSMETEQVDSRFNKFDSFQMRSNISGTEDRIHFPREHEEHFLQPNSEETEPRGSRSSWPLPLCDTSVQALALDRAVSRVSGQTECRVGPLGGILSTNESSSVPRSGFQSTFTSSLGPSMDALGSGGMLGQQRQLPLRSSSPTFPSAQSAPLQQQNQHSPIDHDYLPVLSSQMGQNSSHLSGQFSRDKIAFFSTDSFPISSESPGQKAHTSLNSQPSQLHTSQPSLSPFLEQKQHLSSLQQSLSDQSLQAVQNETSAYVSHGLRATESKGFSGLVHSSGPLDVCAQSNTSNLLAEIFKSDFFPNKPASCLNIHPPLPSGPPPVQTLTSSLPTSTEMTSLGIITPGLAPPLPVGMLPPLPPGPPPSASLLSSSLQTANSASIGLNPLSSLLSSLVAKGIITSTSTQLPAVSSSQMSKESTSQNSELDGSTSTPPLKEFTVRSSSTAHRISLTDNLIGTQFKTEVVREFHPEVIDSLLDDLNHWCNACGLRFRHQEQLQSHLDWHSSSNLENLDTDKVCRRWYSNISSWVSGDIESQCGPASFILLEATSEEHLEPMVMADESQTICAFCGEPFKDFYSVERGGWMYKGAIYLNVMNDNLVARGMEERMVEDPIVHVKCMSASEVYGGVAQRS